VCGLVVCCRRAGGGGGLGRKKDEGWFFYIWKRELGQAKANSAPTHYFSGLQVLLLSLLPLPTFFYLGAAAVQYDC
jgi:hypothetical protein